ncbi:MAG: glycosyltransferase family 1 protein [Gemmatimonadetes bacterium]|nr:glycosyltransferase family 1 protein [Gemmatimonadota bacterium]
MPMRVLAVESSRWVRDVRGIGRYVSVVLPLLAAERPELRIILFAKNGADAQVLRDRVNADAALRGRAEVKLLRELPATTADVFWYPWNAIITKARAGAMVVTVQDVAPLALPDPRWSRWFKNLRAKLRYREVARLATHVITISEFSAREAHRFLGIPYDRMTVVLDGGDFGVPPDAAGDAAALERLGVRGKFLLTVGAADRRKNFPMLQRAMRTVRERHPDLTLVLAGPRRSGSAQDALQPWEQSVGFVSDDDLWRLYRNAEIFVFPSRYEGFGLPVIEAMRVGAPVVSTSAASLPEVGGDAAVYVEPDNSDAMATAILAVLANPAQQRAMRAASVAHAAQFTTWEETARQTIAVFDRAAAMVSAGASTTAPTR